MRSGPTPAAAFSAWTRGTRPRAITSSTSARPSIDGGRGDAEVVLNDLVHRADDVAVDDVEGHAVRREQRAEVALEHVAPGHELRDVLDMLERDARVGAPERLLDVPTHDRGALLDARVHPRPDARGAVLLAQVRTDGHEDAAERLVHALGQEAVVLLLLLEAVSHAT